MKRFKTIIAFLCLNFSTPLYASGYNQQLNNLAHHFLVSETDINFNNSNDNEQLLCLSLTIYYEARGTIAKQQVGVAWVVKNRTHSNRYQSHDMCDIVFERHHSVPQFTWINNLNTGKVEWSSWIQAKQIAKDVYYNKISDPTHGALCFHELSIGTGGYKGIQIGTHVFYNIVAK